MRSILAFSLAGVLLLPAITASADAVDSAVNGSRSTPLPVRADVESVARGSASSQASAGDLFHTSLSGLTSVCSATGEIVGAGPSIALIFELFLQSSTHRPLLLSSNWTAMGTASVTGADGKIYVSVVFCREINPGSEVPASAPPPPSAVPPLAATPPDPPATGTVQPSFTPAAPPVPSFDDVFFRLVTGDLTELWDEIAGARAGVTEPGSAVFLPPADWPTPFAPTLG